MFLPIGDDNPRERTPFVNYALLAANVVTFLLLCFPRPSEAVLVNFALIPADPSPLTLVTSMFLHANLMHLAGNMLFLWIFGDNVEDRLGHFAYLIFYLGAGVSADLLHILTHTGSEIPTLGASGAVSGVVGAYSLFFPRQPVKMLIWFYVTEIAAIWWSAIWFLEQLFFAFRGYGGVAYFAHIGGFLAGVGVAILWKFVLFPRRFGVAKAGHPYPSDLGTASRYRSGPVSKPWLTVEPDITFVQDPAERFAVLRLTDEAADADRIANLGFAAAGIPPRETIHRLRATRGVVARDVPRITAERLQIALRRAGFPTLIAADQPSSPPRPIVPASFSWSDRQIGFLRTGEVARIPWETPFLFLGAHVDGRALIDIFIAPHENLRVDESTPLIRANREARLDQAASLAELARDILRFRQGAVLNEGIRTLASGGQWGWLRFTRAQDFADYRFWAYHVVLSHKPVLR